MTPGLDVREFLAGYLAESEEHLALASTQLMLLEAALQKGENLPRAVRELFRALHTMKGISAMIGAEPIVDIAHEMESALRVADQTGARLTLPAVDLLLRGVRAIEARVSRLARDQPLEPAGALIAELEALRTSPAAAPVSRAPHIEIPADLAPRLSGGEREQIEAGLRRGARLLRIDFVPSPTHVAAGLGITQVRQRLTALGELVKVVPQARAVTDGSSTVSFALLLLTAAAVDDVASAAGATADSVVILGSPVLPDAAPLDAVGEDPVAAPDPGRGSTVRVDVRRLDEALEGLSAVVVTHARLQALAAAGTDRAMQQAVAEAGRRLRDLRGAIMRARTVPVSELLDRAPLVVRGIAGPAGKKVRVEIEPSAIELDKAVADRLFPVLVHLLRNAVDHAVESPEQRRHDGKPEVATIRVACAQRSDAFLEMVVSDDGRGIDRARIAAKAGVPVPGTDEELLALLGRPGFSTLDVATAVSGRGFGMDIVLRTIGELGGELTLRTAVGQGSSFTLQVPLSITIVDVLTFACGAQTYVVPVRAVERLTEAQALGAVATPGARDRGAARLSSEDGRVLPLYDLAGLLGVARDGSPNAKVIIVRRGEERFGFEVDRMLGRKEVVMRPLADPLAQVAGVAGTADLGDGKPTLVLDLVALMRARSEARSDPRSEAHSESRGGLR